MAKKEKSFKKSDKFILPDGRSFEVVKEYVDLFMGRPSIRRRELIGIDVKTDLRKKEKRELLLVFLKIHAGIVRGDAKEFREARKIFKNLFKKHKKEDSK